MLVEVVLKLRSVPKEIFYLFIKIYSCKTKRSFSPNDTPTPLFGAKDRRQRVETGPQSTTQTTTDFGLRPSHHDYLRGRRIVESVTSRDRESFRTDRLGGRGGSGGMVRSFKIPPDDTSVVVDF